jgi:hypothetical protein
MGTASLCKLVDVGFKILEILYEDIEEEDALVRVGMTFTEFEKS